MKEEMYVVVATDSNNESWVVGNEENIYNKEDAEEFASIQNEISDVTYVNIHYRPAKLSWID